MPSAPRELVKHHHARKGSFRVEIAACPRPWRDHVDLPGEQPREHGLVNRHVDQLDLDPFLGEEALLLRDEQGPKADPDEIADPQRLGVGHLACRPADHQQCSDDAGEMLRSSS